MTSGARTPQPRDTGASWLRQAFMALTLLCLGGTMWVILPEYRVFVRAQKPPSTWYLQSATLRLGPLHSLEAHYDALVGCDRVLADLTRRLMPASFQNRVRTVCIDTADTVLAAAPSMSLAYLVRTQAMVHAGQPRAAIDALVLAERTGPSLTWMAARRIELALAIFAHLDPPARAALRRDIGRMFDTHADARRLAWRYRAAPTQAARSFIVDTVEGLPERAQGRFITALRRLG